MWETIKNTAEEHPVALAVAGVLGLIAVGCELWGSKLQKDIDDSQDRQIDNLNKRLFELELEASKARTRTRVRKDEEN